MKSYSEQYKQLEFESIGMSYFNRSIPALRLSNPLAPRILVIGGHHARESISMTQVLYLLDYALKNSSNDIAINKEIVFIPVLIIDGLSAICETYEKQTKSLRSQKY